MEKAQNDLESFIINTQEKLYEDEWEKCSTEENREEIRSKLSEASDWLYEVEYDTPRKVRTNKCC